MNHLRDLFDGATPAGLLALLSLHLHLLLGWVAVRRRVRRLELTLCPAFTAAVPHEQLAQKADR